MACEDHVKSMREEKDRWKMQLQVSSVNDGFSKNVKSKMVGQRRYEPSPVVQPNAQDAQFLSDQYDDLMNSEARSDEDFGKLSGWLESLSKNVARIDKAIDEILSYSYRYNLKIIRVPQVKENESGCLWH